MGDDCWLSANNNNKSQKLASSCRDGMIREKRNMKSNTFAS